MGPLTKVILQFFRGYYSRDAWTAGATFSELQAYLPTPRVQKPGDKPKNVQCGSHIYLRTFFFGFHFFQCYNSTLPTKLMYKKCKRATVGSSREIWCSNRETGRFHEKLGDSRENRESWRNGGNAIVGLVHFADPQSMDYPIWTTKWTKLMDSQMDYLDRLPIWTT